MSRVSDAEIRILEAAGWNKTRIKYLEEHLDLRANLQVYTLDVAEAFADGSVDVLSFVAAMLSRLEPGNSDLPIMYAAANRLRHELARPTRGPGKGRTAHWSIPLEEVPNKVLQAIKSWRGSEKVQTRMLSTLREVLGAARRAVLTEKFDRDALAAFRNELDERDLAAASIKIAMTDCRYLGQALDVDAFLLDLIDVEINLAKREEERQPSKLKAAFRANPISPIDYAQKARKVSEQAYASTEGRQTRHRLFVTAATLAFLSWLPDRVSDIMKLVVGRDVFRTTDGWGSNYFSNKMNEDRSLPLLPEDLTPYLDDLILLGADPGLNGEVTDQLYRQREAMRSPLFATISLEKPYSKNRIFELVKAETGHGIHAARKAMTDYCAEMDAPIEDILSHLGHRSLKTSEKSYAVNAAKIRRKHIQGHLADVREELISSQSTFRVPNGRLIDLDGINRALTRKTGNYRR